jgi:large subunit ribosomal protein L25
MTNTVAAELRPETGKGVARKLRAAGKIPGNIYGAGATSTPITLDPTPLLDIFRKSKNRNTLITLDFNGQQVTTLIKEAQRHPVSRAVLHVDFYKVDGVDEVSVAVPVRAQGKAAGAAIGGRIEIAQRTLKVRCAPNAIPEFLDVDVTALDVGDMVRVSKVVAPEGVAIQYNQDFPVVLCTGKKK